MYPCLSTSSGCQLSSITGVRPLHCQYESVEFTAIGTKSASGLSAQNSLTASSGVLMVVTCLQFLPLAPVSHPYTSPSWHRQTTSFPFIWYTTAFGGSWPV